MAPFFSVLSKFLASPRGALLILVPLGAVTIFVTFSDERPPSGAAVRIESPTDGTTWTFSDDLTVRFDGPAQMFDLRGSVHAAKKVEVNIGYNPERYDVPSRSHHVYLTPDYRHVVAIHFECILYSDGTCDRNAKSIFWLESGIPWLFGASEAFGGLLTADSPSAAHIWTVQQGHEQRLDVTPTPAGYELRGKDTYYGSTPHPKAPGTSWSGYTLLSSSGDIIGVSGQINGASPYSGAIVARSEQPVNDSQRRVRTDVRPPDPVPLEALIPPESDTDWSPFPFAEAVQQIEGDLPPDWFVNEAPGRPVGGFWIVDERVASSLHYRWTLVTDTLRDAPQGWTIDKRYDSLSGETTYTVDHFDADEAGHEDIASSRVENMMVPIDEAYGFARALTGAQPGSIALLPSIENGNLTAFMYLISLKPETNSTGIESGAIDATDGSLINVFGTPGIVDYLLYGAH